MELPQDYDPSVSQQSTNILYGNHYRFNIERLPDLSFFVQSCTTPSITGTAIAQPNPFVQVQVPGEILSFSTFQVTYQVDAHFKSYFSLYYWLRGYGFPSSFDDVVRFREKQSKLVPNARPTPNNLEKTNALLAILTPDTSSIIAEIAYFDVFPTELSPLSFVTTDNEPPVLVTTATFACTSFDVRLTP